MSATDSDLGSKSGRHAPESVAELFRIRWPTSFGITGRHGPDYARQCHMAGTNRTGLANIAGLQSKYAELEADGYIGLSERLFIGAVLNLPREHREWGIVSWLAGTMRISRQSLYAIGKWTKEGLLPSPDVPVDRVKSTPESGASDSKQMIEVTRNRIKRTALALALPGGVSGRSIEICLQTALGEGRSPAFLSALTHEAGQRASEILKAVDHSALGKVVQARDEIFFGPRAHPADG